MLVNQIPKFNNTHLVVVNSVTQFRSSKKVTKKTKKNSFRRKTKKSKCSPECKENQWVGLFNVVIKLVICIDKNIPLIISLLDKLSDGF